MNKKGISMMTLVITIIVVIILATIAIIGGDSAFGKASLAKFISEFGDFETAIKYDYSVRQTEYSSSGKEMSRKQIYYMIGTGKKLEEDEQGMSVGTIAGLARDIEIMPDSFMGEEFYMIGQDTNVTNWKKNKRYYSKTEKHYVTDMGETFTLPGYMVKENDETQWWIAPGKYYVSDKPFVLPILTDTLRVGDYVDYTPDEKQYSTNPLNTGTATQVLSTEDASWRVVYIDDATGEAWITPEGIVNAGVTFSGAKGYYNGPTELNNICNVLYSNEELGIKARSMNVNDMNKIRNYTPKYLDRWAIYPKGTSVSGSETYNGKEYEKIAHGGKTTILYTYDGGGKTMRDVNNYEYRTAEEENPVYVTQSYYAYTPTKISDILGTERTWLASSAIRFDWNYANVNFHLRNVSSASVSGSYLYSSTGGSASPSYGLRPLICLTSSYRVDTGSATANGKTPGTAWTLQ